MRALHIRVLDPVGSPFVRYFQLIDIPYVRKGIVSDLRLICMILSFQLVKSLSSFQHCKFFDEVCAGSLCFGK